MATFKYKAVSNSGSEVEGVIKAHDQNAAIIELKNTVQTVTSITEIQEKPEFLDKVFKRKIKEKELALVCKQFSIILTSGLPIVKAVKLVGEQTEDKNFKQMLLEVADDVRGGSTMASAFEVRGPELPSTFIETVRAGETSGKLDVAFERLARYFTKKSTIQSKVISALIYPAFVLVLAVIVVGVLMIYAIPTFSSSFLSLGMELPGITKALIAVSNFFRKWTWLIVLIVVAIIIGIKIYSLNDEGRYKIDSIRLNIPLLGKVRRMSAASEFASTFSTMLAAGLPAIKALDITANSLTNYKMTADISKACTLVESGYKIHDSLKETSELPDLLLEVTGIGEETGSLENTLGTIAEYYDNEVDVATSRAVSMLEPAIIIVLAVIVIFILFAIYMPMFSIYDAF